MTFQGKLTTKLSEYFLGDPIIELRNDVDRDQLNSIVASLLDQSGKRYEQANFDFIVAGKLLQLTVEKHLEIYSDEIDSKTILCEKLVELEYVLSPRAPKPLEAINQDDWVSCVDCNETHIITGSYDNSISIFALDSRKLIATIPKAHDKPLARVRWVRKALPGKKTDLFFVSAGHDEVSILRKFNTKSLETEIISVFRGHNRSVNSIDINDDVLASGSFDKTLRLWSIVEVDEEVSAENDHTTRGKKKQRIDTARGSVKEVERSAFMTLTGHQESITGVRWLTGSSETNTLATSSLDRTICIWDIELGQIKRRILSSKPLLEIDYNSDKNIIIAASCDRHVRLWDSRAPDNSTASSAYSSHNAWVSSVKIGKSDHFISGGYDNLVKHWDLRSTKGCLYDLIGHHDKVLEVNWSNPHYVMSGSADSTLKVFST